MLWAGKEISKLSDDELMDAINSVAHMDNFRFDKEADPRLSKPKHRLGKIFKGSLPPANPAFVNLVSELNNEYLNRTNPNDA